MLAFLIPHHGQGNYGSTNHPLTPYLTSVDAVEALTGLDFLTSLDDEVEDELERVVPIGLWPTVQPEFLAGPAAPRRLEMQRERMAVPPSTAPAVPPAVQPTAPAMPPPSPYTYSQPLPYCQHYYPCYPGRVIWTRRCR